MMFLLMTVGYSRAHIKLVMVSTVTSLQGQIISSMFDQVIPYLRTGLMLLALSLGFPHPLA